MRALDKNNINEAQKKGILKGSCKCSWRSEHISLKRSAFLMIMNKLTYNLNKMHNLSILCFVYKKKCDPIYQHKWWKCEDEQSKNGFQQNEKIEIACKKFEFRLD